MVQSTWFQCQQTWHSALMSLKLKLVGSVPHMRRRLVRQVKHAGIVKHGECDLITIVQQTIRATHTSASCRGKTPSTLHVQQLPNRSDVVCLPSTSTPLSTCPHLLSSPWPLTSRTPKPNQRRAAELLLGSPLDYAALRAQLSHTRKAFALLHTRQQHKSNGGMGGGGGGGGGGEVTGRGQGAEHIGQQPWQGWCSPQT